jgi:hypothetical protein
MKKNVDAERIRAAFKATQGIVEHSFEQHVIDASQADVNAMIERIALVSRVLRRKMRC